METNNFSYIKIKLSEKSEIRIENSKYRFDRCGTISKNTFFSDK